jgi:cytochrome b561
VGAAAVTAEATEEDTAREVFTAAQVRLHWAIAALIFLQLMMNEGIEIAFAARMDRTEPVFPVTALAHMIVGGSILALTLWRLCLRWRIGVPGPEADANLLIRWSSKLTHIALYVLALGMPLTGAVAWFGHNELASEVHEAGRLALIGVILLHVVGALFEHSIMGNDTLARMLRPGGRIGEAGTTEHARSDG